MKENACSGLNGELVNQTQHHQMHYEIKHSQVVKAVAQRAHGPGCLIFAQSENYFYMESECTLHAAVLRATRGQEALLQEVEAEDEDYYKLSKLVPTK